MKLKLVLALMAILTFSNCGDNPSEADPITDVTYNAEFLEFQTGSTTLKSTNARAERYSDPDRFLAYASNGKSKWEVFAYTQEGDFTSDFNKSFTYIPDTTDLSVVYSCKPGRGEIEISEFGPDTSKLTVIISGTAHNSPDDSVNFVSSFKRVVLSR